MVTLEDAMFINKTDKKHGIKQHGKFTLFPFFHDEFYQKRQYHDKEHPVCHTNQPFDPHRAFTPWAAV